MTQLLRAVWLWLQVSGAVVAAVAVGWMSAQYAFHLKLLNVQTGSMRPTFSPGDALIMQHIAPTNLRVGMIVSYHSSRNPNELVTHRITAIFPEKQSFQTKGDRLGHPDPTVRDTLLVGRVVAILPDLGRPLNWLRTWPGLITSVYTPVVAIAISELYKLECSLSPRIYRLRQRMI
ncbi:MAG TPA: signal peptidase I [Candidatus Saccharimonadales bacterium]|nr:signal peptidase I [Candidatus Saccharimonadales bacterium]